MHMVQSNTSVFVLFNDAMSKSLNAKGNRVMRIWANVLAIPGYCCLGTGKPRLQLLLCRPRQPACKSWRLYCSMRARCLPVLAPTPR